MTVGKIRVRTPMQEGEDNVQDMVDDLFVRGGFMQANRRTWHGGRGIHRIDKEGVIRRALNRHRFGQLLGWWCYKPMRPGW